jgi:HTH-type transcriptional regulator, transcriptional repressor of NAD biosynthesis genes
MTDRFACGFLVGKFSPLHRGHEPLIESALGACDRIVILSYANPELAGCEAARRERWLARLYPNARRIVLDAADCPPNDAPDDTHQAFVAEICKREGETAIDAVFTSESYGPGLAETLAGALGHPVVHVPVDPARARVPISATRIRSDVHAHRDWLSAPVYASFVERVVLLGGESTGKSTLAGALAARFGTEQVPEYGRELWLEKQGQLAYEDLLAIGERQVELEEQAAERAIRTLFCDTSPLTTLFYSLELFGRADPRLEWLSRREYSRVVLCAPDFPFVQDGTRSDPTFRERGHAWYLAELARRGIPFALARGSVEERIETIARSLQE